MTEQQFQQAVRDRSEFAKTVRQSPPYWFPYSEELEKKYQYRLDFNSGLDTLEIAENWFPDSKPDLVANPRVDEAYVYNLLHRYRESLRDTV